MDLSSYLARDREMKDDRDEVRENGTNGEDRKGKTIVRVEIFFQD
jgi:uncharacterized protein YabE (DUF348 family)